jgi:lysophospholipase L1-like esterase
MRATRLARRRRTRFALGLVVAVVVLYLFEIGLRIAGVQTAYQAGAMGSWRMTPGLAHAVQKGPRDGHSFVLSTNGDGLRTDLPKAKTPAKLRVALMGDSTVFGWGVDDGNAVSDGLQAALDAAAPGTVEVLNAGQPGYSTTQVAWFFDGVVAAYQPDRLVVFQTMHDFNTVVVSDRELLAGGATAGARLRVLLAQHSRVYQVLRQALWPLTDQPMLLPDQATGEPRVARVSDTEREQNFDALRARLATWGGRLLIGYLPFHADLTGHGGDRPGMAWGVAYAKAHDVDVIDLRACCGTDSEALVLADDHGHLAAAGNLRVGAALAPAIQASLAR